MRNTAAKLFATLAIATSLATVAAGQASADPSVLPAAQDIVGVGSDTTQSVLNQFSTDYNTFLGTGSTLPHLYSWDAAVPGSTTIANTKTGSVSNITRPNGSGAGITALATTYTNTTVDFARASRGPVTGGPTGLDFVSFAKDLISWAGNSAGHAPANLTAAQLTGIYNCTITNWSTVGGTAGTIKPFLPPTSSGTRSTFLAALGLTAGGTCVSTTVNPQENEGTDATFNDPDVIFPYSAGHYNGQVNYSHTTTIDAPGYLTLRSVDGVFPITTSNTLAIGTTPAFNSSFSRVLYNVLRHSEFSTGTGTQPTALRAIFNSTGWVCTNATAKLDVTNYGFYALNGTRQCGAVTTT